MKASRDPLDLLEKNLDGRYLHAYWFNEDVYSDLESFVKKDRKIRGFKTATAPFVIWTVER
jgi:hypothetical protein